MLALIGAALRRSCAWAAACALDCHRESCESCTVLSGGTRQPAAAAPPGFGERDASPGSTEINLLMKFHGDPSIIFSLSLVHRPAVIYPVPIIHCYFL